MHIYIQTYSYTKMDQSMKCGYVCIVRVSAATRPKSVAEFGF